MKLTLQRTLFEIANVLMALLFVIPLGIFVEQLCGWPLFRCCFIPCFSVIGYLIGRFSMTKPINLSMILSGVGLAVSTALAIVCSLGLGVAGVLLSLITAFFSMFFFFSARKAGYTIYAPMSVAGILIHLVILFCCTGFRWSDRVTSFTSACAIGFFLLSLFALSAKGLRRSLHRSSSSKRVVYPAGMQMGNFLLVTGFILIAVFVSNITPIFRLFSRAFSVVIDGIVTLFFMLGNLFAREKKVETLVETVSSVEKAVSVADEDNIMAYEPKGEAQWFTQAVEIFAFICVMLFLIYAIYVILKKLHTSGIGRRFLKNLRDRFAPVEDEDYEDENENLFDMKTMLSDTRENLKNALRKIRERPQKVDDFPDDRMKLRFVFQQLLKKVRGLDPGALARTPNELYQKDYSGDREIRQFMDYYNQAKYSDGDLPDDAADVARRIAKQKL